jgi:heme/copper-type cytochrome/quinol oxidase subunit 2
MNRLLAEAIFWIAALACVLAEAAILRSTYIARKVEKSALVPAASRNGEIAWAIIPALGLAALLVTTWQRVEARDAHMRMMESGMQGMPGMSAPSRTR